MQHNTNHGEMQKSEHKPMMPMHDAMPKAPQKSDMPKSNVHHEQMHKAAMDSAAMEKKMPHNK